MNKIKFPIAISKKTGNLLKIEDAENGLKCDCKCFNCNEDMIACNEGKKQEHHFRHKPNSKCNINFESYIHWLAKEIVKTMDYITLPPIHYNDLVISSTILRKTTEASIISSDQLKFQGEEKVSFKKGHIDIEKEFSTELGKIRADIVVSVNNSDLLIEPFYTNKIDEEKIKKISNLDKSTISINLLSFVEKNRHHFNLDTLKEYLMNDLSSKKWIYIRKHKANNLIEKMHKQISFYSLENKNIKLYRKEVHFLDERNKELGKRITYLQNQINKLENEIKSNWKRREEYSDKLNNETIKIINSINIS